MWTTVATNLFFDVTHCNNLGLKANIVRIGTIGLACTRSNTIILQKKRTEWTTRRVKSCAACSTGTFVNDQAVPTAQIRIADRTQKYKIGSLYR